MQLTMVVVGCFLLGQVPADAPSPSAAQRQPPAVLQPTAEPQPVAAEGAVPQTDPAAAAADEALNTEAERPAKTEADTPAAETLPASVPPARRQLTPPEMVAEALVMPPGSRLAGRPLSLLAALSSTTDRRHQLEVAHAYWRLTEAVAAYHFSLAHDRRLQGLEAGGEHARRLRTARASSAALVREAEVAAVAAQHELAALVLLSPDSPLPLPADRPHVGPYRTYFDRLFPMRTAPARTRLIDRTLPIRHRAVNGRASAVQAAEDALSAAVDAHRLGRTGLPAVLACIEECLRQREAFIRSVCRYNHEIADYALAVIAPGSNGQVLVGMLISPTLQPIRPLASGNDGMVAPAGHTERVPTPARRPGQNVPTPARRPGQREPTPARRPGQNVPTPAGPRTVPRALDKQVPAPATRWSPSQPPGKNQPTPAPQREEKKSSESAPPEQPPVPAEPKPTVPTPRKVDKPIADMRGNFLAPALYPALADAPPDTQARQLTLTLHWDRALPEGIGEPVSLEDCLGKQSGGDRRELIEAYWLARQRAAEYQVLVEQAQLLDGLALVPLDEKHPSGLRLRSARLATEAALHEVHAALLEAQFELATRLGRESDAAWPISGTVPHADPYPVKLDAQPRRLAESWPLRRLAAIIPGLAKSVQHRAVAVVEADAARADAAASSQAGSEPVELLFGCINRQTEETLAFLGTLTDYNQAIAEYALTVLPPETPGEKLAAALTVCPEQPDN